jgi:hypothetical protein
LNADLCRDTCYIPKYVYHLKKRDVKKILVLTDFSEHAIVAEKYALQLAMQAMADIILYNVYPHRARNISGNVVWPHDEPEPTFELQSISNLRSRVSELNHGLSKMSDTVYKAFD